ncbi:primase-helicase family protein [Delftia sp.]|uniref:primase-helicase family protein n=1 Tax=Delftia sp. TaxID=1886637 RepID=UPI00259C9FBB|nr:primase-helicase family protein [Delftia sp.]
MSTVQPMLDLVEHLTGAPGSQPNPITASLLLSWLAHPLQDPHGKLRSALVLRGPRGNGTAMLLDVMDLIHGAAYLPLGSAKLLDEPFNGFLSGKRLVKFDELPTVHKHREHIKALMCHPTLQINAKAQPVRTELNRLNLVFVTTDATPIGPDDRRYFVIDTAPPAQTRPELYRELIHWRGRGGAIDFGEYLRQYPLTTDFLDEHAFAGRPT